MNISFLLKKPKLKFFKFFISLFSYNELLISHLMSFKKSLNIIFSKLKNKKP